MIQRSTSWKACCVLNMFWDVRKKMLAILHEILVPGFSSSNRPKRRHSATLGYIPLIEVTLKSEYGQE